MHSNIDVAAERPMLSVVAPLFDEEIVLPEFHRRLSRVLDRLEGISEIVYVNDGSRDKTLSLLHELRQSDSRVAIVNLSRNFGKEIALTAGMDHSRGESVVIIDSDLQDPPELIPQLLDHWRKGFDVVYATRIAREGETYFKKETAKWFYRIIGYMSRIEIPADTGDFRLLSRRAVDAVRRLREQHRFMKGLFAWIGFPQTSIAYHRDPRFAGDTKWNYWKLWNLAMEGITSFTTTPLKLASYSGLIAAFVAFVYSVWIIYKTLRFGDPVAGYPSLMVVILFLGGIQLTAIGIIGEYLGRIFNETKHRPLYLVETYVPPMGSLQDSSSIKDADLAR
jgi:glycosyltransferase involved in cell wall biosynthesis